MSLSASEIAAVVKVLDGDLKGGVIRKAISPLEPDRIVLEVRTAGENHLLQVVVAAAACRLGRIDGMPRKASVPHPFAMLLRKVAEGRRIASVQQLGDDRVVEIALSGKSGSGALVCELTSRHANLFWVGDDGAIGGSFHPNRSSRRRLVPGQPYAPPSPRPDARDAARFSAGPELEREIERHYRREEERLSVEAEHNRLARALRTGRKRLEKLAANLDRDMGRALEADRLQNGAYLLQANLRRARRGMKRLEVTDFEGNPAVVDLDPALDPVENMERLFDRAKRLKRAVGKIDDRIAATRSDLRALGALADRLEGADAGGLGAVEEALEKRFPDLARRASRARGAEAQRLPFREFSIGAGRTARVGRSAADNDALTLRHAKPQDLWLHVRGRKGSHVIVPMGRGEDPTPGILIDAAHLAVRFSGAKNDDEVEVTYTRRKYVQKPRGAPPGSVRLLKEKTLFLKVDPARLKALLG